MFLEYGSGLHCEEVARCSLRTFRGLRALRPLHDLRRRLDALNALNKVKVVAGNRDIELFELL